MSASRPQPDSVVIERFTRAFGRIEGYEDLGLDDEALRELESLPPAVREVPTIQLRLGRVLERLERFDEALTLYNGMDPSAFSELGRVRCLAQSGRLEEACALLDEIPFDPAAVKEFVEARALVR
jgi:hypothetical protein